MQLHGRLLLLTIIFTILSAPTDTWHTDKALAEQCGGNITLDAEPPGGLRLALRGPLCHSDPSGSPGATSAPLVADCVLSLDIPGGLAVWLRLEQAGGEADVSVSCVRTRERHVLKRGDAALLSGCDRGKASLIWTGARNCSDAIRLSYSVQEGERNSSEDHTRAHSTHGSGTGTGFTDTATPGEEVPSGGHLYQGPGSRTESHPSSPDRRPPHPASTPLLTAAPGRADRETQTLPGEAANNGTDTSGAPHLTVGAGGRTHPDIHVENAEPGDVPSSTTAVGLDGTHGVHTHRRTTTPTPRALSSSSVPLQTTGGTFTVSGGAPGEELSDPWRSQRSTQRLVSAAMAPVTGDPSKPAYREASSSARYDTGPPSSPSTSQSSSGTSSSTASLSGSSGATAAAAAAYSHPSTSRTDTFESAASDVASQTEAFGNLTSDPGSGPTRVLTRSPPPHTFSSFTSTNQGERRRNVNTTALPASPAGPGTNHSTYSSSGSPSSPDTETAHEGGPVTEAPHPTHTPEHSTAHGSWAAKSQPFTLQLTPHPATLSFTPDADGERTAQPATTGSILPPPSSAARTPLHDFTATSAPPPLSTMNTENVHVVPHTEREEEFERFPGSGVTNAPAGAASRASTDPFSGHTPSVPTSAPRTPTFYIVPDEPAAVRVESFELLLQIIVEESRSASPVGLERDTGAWLKPYLLRASGFRRLLGVWSSGRSVQSLLEFTTSGALPWLGSADPAAALLERTGLGRAARDGRSFRSSAIANVTLGGLQGDVCDWLLQCPAGFKCVSRTGTANYSCSSVCRLDHCHHHGICTHHPDQPPVCRCLVGGDFWFMGQRCDIRMTHARLVGTCLAVLLIAVTVIAALALVAVRRYKAILIQAKVDQTRSSYRRFNHFDELSGRFWLRSLAGSADSLDNPAFTRSDELLHLRALDRPCCYHDDTLSLASTCPSHGAHINTIYPHSSQYGWRGSEMSMGEGVLDSGKASDLSVCSWPVEPIHWTPFPLLQSLASHRTPTVRVSRPRSYCEGMELVDMGKSWTA